MVGLERTFYQVSEDVGVVEVCAVVYSPNDNCQISFAFDVSFSTIDGSAGDGSAGDGSAGDEHYCIHTLNINFLSLIAGSSLENGAIDTILIFAACEMRSCVDVFIMDDKTLGNIETIHLTLERTTGLDSRITLNPANGVVEVTDDDGKYNNYMMVHGGD